MTYKNNKLKKLAIQLFYKHYPPFAHISYTSETVFYIWKHNLHYLKLMFNSNNKNQINRINNLRKKFLFSYFSKQILISIKPDNLENYNIPQINNIFFNKIKLFIKEYGFKSYYFSNILNFNEQQIENRFEQYYKILDYVKHKNYYKNTKHIGLNYCVNFFDNINLLKVKDKDILGFAFTKINKCKNYDFFLGLNIKKEELQQKDISEYSSVFLHEQTHLIDMGVFCYLNKPKFVMNDFSNYKLKKNHYYFYNIYQEILYFSYNSIENKNSLSMNKEILEVEIIQLYDSLFPNNIYDKKNKKISFINKIEKQFFSKKTKKSLFYNKLFFQYLYKKDKDFDLLHKNLNLSFIENFYFHDIDYQKYLLRPEEKFANTRFSSDNNPYINFLFEELVVEIFNTKNIFFYNL